MKVFFWAIAVLLLATLHAGVVPERPAQKKSGAIRKLGNGPRIENGKIKFQDSIDVEIEVADKGRKMVKLDKRNINTEQRTAVYTAKDIILRQECEDENLDNCKEYALVKGAHDTTYLKSNGQALVLPNSEDQQYGTDDSDDDDDEEDLANTQDDRGNDEIIPNFRKKKAMLYDTLYENDLKVIKLIMFADKGVVKIFLDFNNNDVYAAKRDAKKYLTLVTNEMTMTYQTLSDYGRRMKINGAPGYNMDLAVTLVDVVFPPIDSVTDNFDFSQDYKWSGKIHLIKIQKSDGSFRKTGSLIAFRNYLKNDFSTNQIYDHAMFITGYGLRQYTKYADGTKIYNSLAGIASFGTLCKSGAKSRGRHSSISILTGDTARIASHELGHGFGIDHDVDANDAVNCPNKQYIMSKGVVHPTTETSDTFYKFSKCSAKFVEDYTNGISANSFIDTCLQSPDNAFRTRICKGLVGTSVSFDKQCEIQFGLGSYRKPFRTTEEEAILQKGFVKQCVANDDFSNYPFRCQDPVRENSYYRQLAAAPGTHCVNPNDGSLDTAYICYNGRCMYNKEIC